MLPGVDQTNNSMGTRVWLALVTISGPVEHSVVLRRLLATPLPNLRQRIAGFLRPPTFTHIFHAHADRYSRSRGPAWYRSSLSTVLGGGSGGRGEGERGGSCGMAPATQPAALRPGGPPRGRRRLPGWRRGVRSSPLAGVAAAPLITAHSLRLDRRSGAALRFIF